MKLILVIFAVTSVVTFANGLPSSEAEFDFDVSDIDLLTIDYMLDNGLPITDDQIQCIRDGVQTVIDDNPELQWWFDEVEKSMTKLQENAIKCASLTGINQKRCYLKLKLTAQLELSRLVKLLPAEQKAILLLIKGIVKGCLE
ncbi:uncharacterized protein LOC129579701 [Sitodiplosis mosellana]|uniref:uncharacterized protein LOC129579701 n=1 Tax=Sitodiplosis mosellana TaxID=263140 RepID=UPI0024441D48|nr:uncharacterized protein LOC129579701 [Sitodiplosis mosellana]